ncbi:MAG TPA: nickel pincer cofactor biosynthesis protein LarC [Terriglobia bacterium]|nr:nickel pincer cofactor biosynthesis protein LarC [Terriglobia bacterium]
MAQIAYLDASSGISGDMLLAAMLDAGLPEAALLAELGKMTLGPYEFKSSQVMRSSLAGRHIEFVIPEKQPHRHLHHIEKMLNESALSESVKRNALAVFKHLAEAEGKLHAKPPGSVHFHEVGAVDAVLDIAGACAGLELLAIDELYCSPLNVGGGHVQAAHGTLPIPAPATAELLKGLPVYSTGVEGELVTPTGAAIVRTLAKGFGPMPAMKVAAIGYGAGTRDFPGRPNIARLFVGEKSEGAATKAAGGEVISVIQANVDDMNPQLFGYMMEKALAAGALDVTCAAIQMKKNRPGLEITVLCSPNRVDTLARILFQETTTLGVRIHEARRITLEREAVSVETAYGLVRMKVARSEGRIVNNAPEYDDCRRIAEEKSVPLKEVMAAAQAAFHKVSGFGCQVSAKDGE